MCHNWNCSAFVQSRTHLSFLPCFSLMQHCPLVMLFHSAHIHSNFSWHSELFPGLCTRRSHIPLAFLFHDQTQAWRRIIIKCLMTLPTYLTSLFLVNFIYSLQFTKVYLSHTTQWWIQTSGKWAARSQTLDFLLWNEFCQCLGPKAWPGVQNPPLDPTLLQMQWQRWAVVSILKKYKTEMTGLCHLTSINTTQLHVACCDTRH